jgi:prepilin-type N-terminal cleavage/methylation domain-containing protein
MRRSAQHGFTLIETAVAVAVMGALALIGVALMRDSLGTARTKGGVRALADLLSLARAEAIRTGDNHIVFFSLDAADNALTGPSGGAAAALLIRDIDADGAVDNGERVAAVNVDQTGSLAWGSAFAAAGSDEAPQDNPGATFPASDPDFLCCTFLEPDGGPARWVLFMPDGMPRAFEVGPFDAGDVGSGNGAVYVTSGERDYAVVLAPLGGVRVHAFERGEGAWTN